MDAMTRHYEMLRGPERFALMIEAMARGDETEADRLEDTCPRLTYRCEEAEFRDRMKRAYSIAATVALNMRAGLARIQMAKTFGQVSRAFAPGPVVILAQTAFLYGRAYGHWEAGKIESIDLPDPKQLAAEAEADPMLGQQMSDLRELSGDAVGKVAETLQYAVGEADAVDLLSQWEGFGRFCRERLALEPLTVTAAFGLGRDDPAAGLAAAFPDARLDEAEAARWAAQWARGWDGGSVPLATPERSAVPRPRQSCQDLRFHCRKLDRDNTGVPLPAIVVNEAYIGARRNGQRARRAGAALLDRQRIPGAV
jgi:hypothetical protein